MPDSEPRRATAPSVPERLATVARFPVGAALTAVRHLCTLPVLARRNEDGDGSDLPPELPADTVDTRSKRLADGHGPLFHRTVSVTVDDADVDAAGVIARLTADLDRPAPFHVVTFRKILGELGRLAVGDEYLVRMPTPWDGPVRVVHRDACAFRLGTLSHHLEAGQIEFRARDRADGAVDFEIETWSAAGDMLARLFYVDLRVGREIQLALWVQFALGVVELACGRRRGPVRARTRRVAQPSRLTGPGPRAAGSTPAPRASTGP